MKLQALIKLTEAGTSMLVSIMEYDSEDETVSFKTGVALMIAGHPYLDTDLMLTGVSRDGWSMGRHINSCRFLEVVGHECRKGNLLDISVN